MYGPYLRSNTHSDIQIQRWKVKWNKENASSENSGYENVFKVQHRDHKT